MVNYFPFTDTCTYTEDMVIKYESIHIYYEYTRPRAFPLFLCTEFLIHQTFRHIPPVLMAHDTHTVVVAVPLPLHG